MRNKNLEIVSSARFATSITDLPFRDLSVEQIRQMNNVAKENRLIRGTIRDISVYDPQEACTLHVTEMQTTIDVSSASGVSNWHSLRLAWMGEPKKECTIVFDDETIAVRESDGVIKHIDESNNPVWKTRILGGLMLFAERVMDND